jgi:hypothetical protein
MKERNFKDQKKKGKVSDFGFWLTSSVPNLGLDGLVVDHKRLGLELDPDGGLGFQAELVPREPGQELRLPHRRVSDQHHLQHVVDLLVVVVVPLKIRHLSFSLPTKLNRRILSPFNQLRS